MLVLIHVSCDNTCIYIGPRDVPMTSPVIGHSLERERDLSVYRACVRARGGAGGNG